MNINDILLLPEPKTPNMNYKPIVYCMPPKRVVICQDKILKNNPNPNQNDSISTSFPIVQNNGLLGKKLDFYEIKSTNEALVSVNDKCSRKHPLKTNRVSRITLEERKRIKKRIGNFDQNKSQAWKYLSLVYGPQIKQDELFTIAEFVSTQLQICIDRDAKRRKSILIKWFDENWTQIAPLFQLYR